MFKTKTWTEVSRRFTPPNTRLSSVRNIRPDTLDTLRKLLHGFTTVELRCNETGELKFIEVYGDQRNN